MLGDEWDIALLRVSRGAPVEGTEGGTMRGRILRLTMAVLTAALAVSLAVSLAACGGRG